MSLMEFYDYIEIQPPSVYEQLQRDQNFSLEKIQKILANIITLADRIKKKVVVSSAAYHVTDQDQMIRDIFVKTKGLRGQYHYLFRKNNLQQMVPTQHLRTYEELQQEFNFLPVTMQKKIILTNPQQLVLTLKPVKISKKKLYPPQVPHAQTDIES